MIGSILAALVALEHIIILVVEMMFWTHRRVRKGFGITASFAMKSRVMAANQGLYNGFLAAGLLWGLSAGKTDVVLFFLGCVTVAGLFGALTVSHRIFFVQALPAIAGIAAILAGI